MQSVSEIIQKQNDANNEKYLKSKHCQSNCDKCMAAGACGIWEKPAYYDGKYLVAATKVFCSKRNDCEKLSSYRSEWIEKNKKNSGLKDLLNKRINDFVASDPCAICAPSARLSLPMTASISPLPRLQVYTLSPAFSAMPRLYCTKPFASAAAIAARALSRSVFPAFRKAL